MATPAEHSQSPTYPMIQPLRAVLYFENAESFGDWRILISKTAEKHLREACKADAGMFKIYIKKLQLARSHFPILCRY
jgi:hypothetical protein